MARGEPRSHGVLFWSRFIRIFTGTLERRNGSGRANNILFGLCLCISNIEQRELGNKKKLISPDVAALLLAGYEGGVEGVRTGKIETPKVSLREPSFKPTLVNGDMSARV